MRRLLRIAQCLIHGPSTAATILGRLKALPMGSMFDLLQGGPALIVAPHPDDETLGCGGLIALARRAGVAVDVVIVTDGSASHPGTIDPGLLRTIRQGEATRACAELGVTAEHVHFLDVPDGQAPHAGPAARAVATALAGHAVRIGATTIFTTWHYDSHPDHVAVFRYAAAAATRTGAALYAYPVWAWMLPPRTLLPNLKLAGMRLPIGPVMEAKHAALRCHASQFSGGGPGQAEGFALLPDHLAVMLTSTECYIASNSRSIRDTIQRNRIP